MEFGEGTVYTRLATTQAESAHSVVRQTPCITGCGAAVPQQQLKRTVAPALTGSKDGQRLSHGTLHGPAA